MQVVEYTRTIANASGKKLGIFHHRYSMKLGHIHFASGMINSGRSFRQYDDGQESLQMAAEFEYEQVEDRGIIQFYTYGPDTRFVTVLDESGILIAHNKNVWGTDSVIITPSLTFARRKDGEDNPFVGEDGTDYK